MGDESNLPAWEDVKKLLDDPNVSDEKKRSLALAYAAEDDWSIVGIRDEVEPYLEKYDDGYWATAGESLYQAGAREENLEETYDAAKAEHDEAAGKRAEHERAVENGKAKLEDSARKGENGEHGGAGAKTGDELLDAGEPGLAYFENWIPLYEKIRSDKEDPGKALDLKTIHELYDQQRQLDFDKFAKNVQDLERAEKAMRESMRTMSDKLGGLWKSWTGGASQASQEFFSSQFNPTAQERVIATVSDAASATQSAVETVAQLVRNKASTTLEYDKHARAIGKKAHQDWDTTIRVANGELDDMLLKQACQIWNIQIDDDCWGDLTDEVRQRIQTECRRVVRGTFATSVEKSCEGFKKLCDNAKRDIDEAWGRLNAELGKAEENPFSDPGPAPAEGGAGKGGAAEGGGQQSAGGGAANAGGSSQPSGGSAGGGSTGGGGAGTGGAGSAPPAPEMPKPPETPEPPKAPEAPAPSGPGTPAPSEQEKVSLGEGENAVTVHEPGADGRTQVELIGADGQPKTYAVDFGRSGPDAAEPGQLPAQLGGQLPSAAGEAAGEQPPEEPQPTPVRPGPDGTAVIREGDRTITLQQGEGGAIELSVDNGAGRPPLAQTVQFGAEPQAPTLGDEPPAPEATAGPAPAAPEWPAAQPAPVLSGDLADEPLVGAASGGAAGVSATPAPGTSGGPVPGTPAPTTPQASGMNTFTSGDGVQNSFGSATGDLFGGSGEQQPKGAAGLSSLGEDSGPAQSTGSTGMSSLGGDPAGGGQQNQSSSAMGGGMMGGGMMGGAGQGQGGDQERTNESPWRTQGQLFDDGVEPSNVRFRSVLGEEQDR